MAAAAGSERATHAQHLQQLVGTVNDESDAAAGSSSSTEDLRASPAQPASFNPMPVQPSPRPLQPLSSRPAIRPYIPPATTQRQRRSKALQPWLLLPLACLSGAALLWVRFQQSNQPPTKPGRRAPGAGKATQGQLPPGTSSGSPGAAKPQTRSGPRGKRGVAKGSAVSPPAPGGKVGKVVEEVVEVVEAEAVEPEAAEPEPAPLPDSLEVMVASVTLEPLPRPVGSLAPAPLQALTFLVSEDTALAGLPTTFGLASWAPLTAPAPAHHPLVQRALAAGATCLGSSSCQPACIDLLGANCGNPLNRHRAAGGGHTGAVLAVASGAAAFACAPDALGQVRVPAACCGLYAFRPSPSYLGFPLPALAADPPPIPPPNTQETAAGGAAAAGGTAGEAAAAGAAAAGAAAAGAAAAAAEGGRREGGGAEGFGVGSGKGVGAGAVGVAVMSVVARDPSVVLKVAQALGAPGSANIKGEIIKFVVAQDLFDMCAPEFQPAILALKKAILKWAGADQAGAVQLVRFLASNLRGWEPLIPSHEATDRDGVRVSDFLEAAVVAGARLEASDLWARAGSVESLASQLEAASGATSSSPALPAAAGQPEQRPSEPPHSSRPDELEQEQEDKGRTAAVAVADGHVAAPDQPAPAGQVAGRVGVGEGVCGEVGSSTGVAAEGATVADSQASSDPAAAAVAATAVAAVAAAAAGAAGTAAKEATGISDEAVQAVETPGAAEAAEAEGAAAAAAGAAAAEAVETGAGGVLADSEEEQQPGATTTASSSSSSSSSEAPGRASVLPPAPSEVQLQAARQLAAELHDCLRATVKPDTIMVLPALPFPAPRRDASEVEKAVFSKLARCFSVLASLGGCPSLTVPVGRLRDGSPIAISLMAVQKFDLRLLAVAQKLCPMIQDSFEAVKLELAQMAAKQAEDEAKAVAGTAGPQGSTAPTTNGHSKGADDLQGKASAANGTGAKVAQGSGAVNGSGGQGLKPSGQHSQPPAGVDPKKAEKAEKAKAKGNEYFQAGKFMEALTEYTRAISFNPNNHVYYSNRAMACIKLFRFEQAEDDCNKVLRFELADKDKVKALLRRATARDALQKYEGAEADLRAVLSLEPVNKQAREDLQALRRHQTEMAQAQAAMVAHMRAQQVGMGSSGGGGMVPQLPPGFDLNSLPPGIDLAHLGLAQH